MIRLAMLRHGHTHWNRAGRIQGRTDIPLDDEARADLAAFRLPSDWANAALVSSPLHRARETAEIVAGRAPETVDSLIEMNWGDWEGLKGIDLKADPNSGFRDIEYWGWDYQPPGGETPAEVWNRLADWVFSLKADTLAVCHDMADKIAQTRNPWLVIIRSIAAACDQPGIALQRAFRKFTIDHRIDRVVQR